ncbi:hypothetical protein ABT255_19470 [Streptomyces mirabilis]|uniref:hypothetical protein n=1 Tax=Streptomyces mirabilis TaxID=68239 RepID=UPI0033337AE8
MRCHTPPTALRRHAVLRYLSGAEAAEVLCGRLRVCRDCFDQWCQTFLGSAARGLAEPEDVLAADAEELRQVLGEAQEELTVWERLAVAAITFPPSETSQVRGVKAER